MASARKTKELLSHVFDRLRRGLRKDISPDEYEQKRHDFVFHMTDWEKDLRELTALFERPGQTDLGTACNHVVGFLYHVIPHLNAAGRLLLDEIPDAFSRPPGPTPAKDSE